MESESRFRAALAAEDEQGSCGHAIAPYGEADAPRMCRTQIGYAAIVPWCASGRGWQALQVIDCEAPRTTDSGRKTACRWFDSAPDYHNKGFAEWGVTLGVEVMAAALIDRLMHHGRSMRDQPVVRLQKPPDLIMAIPRNSPSARRSLSTVTKTDASAATAVPRTGVSPGSRQVWGGRLEGTTAIAILPKKRRS